VEKISVTISEAEAQADADKCKGALHGGIFGVFTTKTDVLISVLGARTTADMQLIKKAYQAKYNRDFTKDISDDCSGHFKDALLQMCCEPGELDAKLIRQAIKGLLTDEDLLSEIICTRTSAELKAASEAYTRLFNRNMENDIKHDTSGDLAKVYNACLALNRGSRTANVEDDVAALYKAGEGRFFGTDHAVFINIIAQSSREHVNNIFARYAEKHGERFDKVIREQMGGDTGKALANLVTPHHVLYAEKIVRSLHGTLGVHNADLIRILTSQRGRHLKHAGRYYLEVVTKTVSASIEHALSGDYKKLMYAICQAEGV
jgi:annexin A13